MVKGEPIPPLVEAEEAVYSYTYVGNEAPPLWCYGSTCLVRVKDDVFVSGYKGLEAYQPYNNVTWLLFKREKGAWVFQQTDDVNRTREPCPLAGFPDGRLFLSVNPTLALPSERHGPAVPQILKFSTTAPQAPYQVLKPEWEGDPDFSQHSYRGLAADADRRELIVMNIQEHECYHWSLMDSDEHWVAQGVLPFPWGADYEEPQPIRLCYPEIVLSNRAVHFLGVSDIIEPVRAWREARFEVTQRSWDYDFRRLFYTYTLDITSAPFADWVEVASREKTSGHIRNLDLWLAPNGDVHVLWYEHTTDPRIRDRFFPEEKLIASLERCVIRDGEVVVRDTLCRGGEGISSTIPVWGRFHITQDGRMFVFYSVGEMDRSHPLSAVQTHGTENWLTEIDMQEGGHSEPNQVALEYPLRQSFMTATPRAGSPPSNTLELLGESPLQEKTIRYARIRIA